MHMYFNLEKLSELKCLCKLGLGGGARLPGTVGDGARLPGTARSVGDGVGGSDVSEFTDLDLPIWPRLLIEDRYGT